MLDLQPFGEFWINCWFNNNYSILTSIDKKYIDAAYMNTYKYRIVEERTANGTNLEYLMIGHIKEQRDLVSSV